MGAVRRLPEGPEGEPRDSRRTEGKKVRKRAESRAGPQGERARASPPEAQRESRAAQRENFI